jgi:hypothetical protein
MRSINKLLTFAAFIFLSGWPFGAQAKRAAPPVVKPVVKNGVQFSYDIEKLKLDCPSEAADGCGDRVYVVAKKVGAKDSVKWKTEVYRAVFDRKMETDVQAILPKSLKIKNANIELTDEHGEKYLVARTSGKLVKPKEPVVYDGP